MSPTLTRCFAVLAGALVAAPAFAECDLEVDPDCSTIVLPGHVPPSTVSANFDGQGVVDNPKPTLEYMHGFRIGYNYVNVDLEQASQLRSNHLLVMGYEFTERLYGGNWLNVIMVQNLMVSGIEQSLFIPNANFLIGFEADRRFQIGVGPNINVFDDEGKYIHMVAALGFTPDVGVFNVPFHISYIPDVDGDWRAAVTTGVNW